MKEDKLEMDVENIVRLTEVHGFSKDKVDIIREVSEKCKSPAAADE